MSTPSLMPTTLPDARPFLKWVGGKHQLLAQFEKLFPAQFERYVEPFVGGGAIFFHLRRTGRLPRQVYLLDNNAEIVNAYRVVRDQLDELLHMLAKHQINHGKTYYYHIRSLDRSPIPISNVERAARTIYLNKTCYNGLYRVNRKGQFNAPMGEYTAPCILNADGLCAANQALQQVEIEQSDFRAITQFAQAGDFFYFDPPYDPVSKTANFTGYTSGSFREQDQRDLASVFDQLTGKGCLCMLSNSHTPLILDLYRHYHITTVSAKRAINSKAAGRGDVQEVVIRNYP